MSTYSSNLRIELITTGTQAGTWGNTTNDNYQYILEQAIAGNVSVSVTTANQALTYLNGPTSTAAANQSVRAMLTLSTTTGANFAVYAPPVSKAYIIYNSSAYTATIYNSTVIGNTTAAGLGIAIPAGQTMTLWSDGTNFYQQNTALISPALSGTPTAPTATGGTNTTQIATTAFVTSAISSATGALGTMSTQNANNVAITGGAINGTPIGGSSAAAVTGTTVTATSQFSGPGTGLTGTASGLSIGGNAATATSATNATTAATVSTTVASGATGTTQSNGDNSTKIATTAYVQSMGLGWGQTWQNVSGSRSAGTTYTNTTGKPIVVSIWYAQFSDSTWDNQLTVGGVLVARDAGGRVASGTNGGGTVSAIVPNNTTYSYSGYVGQWNELR